MTASPIRSSTILVLAAPIVLSSLAQNLMALITLSMVGRLGDSAVAGMGVGDALYSILLAILFGLDAGVQAVVSRRAGAQESHLAGEALSDAFLISAIVGVILTLAAYALGPMAAALLVHDPVVVAQAKAYLFAQAPSLMFLGAIYSIVAYWNGIGTPKYSLLVILVVLPCNAALTACLVFGYAGLPRLGIAGAGLGATLAAILGLGLDLLLVARVLRVPGFLSRPPTLSGVVTLARLGYPVSLQQSLSYLGLIVFVGIVGRIGTAALAAGNVLNSILLVAILASTGIAIASATLVGAALGRRDAEDARRWGWRAAWLAALLLLPFSVVLLAAPRAVLGLFLHDDATITLAVTPLRILAIGVSLDAFGRVIGWSLRGAGATRTAAAVPFVLQWGLQLPLAWWLGVRLGQGLAGICVTQLLLGVTNLAIMALIWRSDRWARTQDRTRRRGDQETAARFLGAKPPALPHPP